MRKQLLAHILNTVLIVTTTSVIGFNSNASNTTTSTSDFYLRPAQCHDLFSNRHIDHPVLLQNINPDLYSALLKYRGLTTEPISTSSSLISIDSEISRIAAQVRDIHQFTFSKMPGLKYRYRTETVETMMVDLDSSINKLKTSLDELNSNGNVRIGIRRYFRLGPTFGESVTLRSKHLMTLLSFYLECRWRLAYSVEHLDTILYPINRNLIKAKQLLYQLEQVDEVIKTSSNSKPTDARIESRKHAAIEQIKEQTVQIRTAIDELNFLSEKLPADILRRKELLTKYDTAFYETIPSFLFEQSSRESLQKFAPDGFFGVFLDFRRQYKDLSNPILLQP